MQRVAAHQLLSLGRQRLGLFGEPRGLCLRQQCADLGQHLLVDLARLGRPGRVAPMPRRRHDPLQRRELGHVTEQAQGDTQRGTAAAARARGPLPHLGFGPGNLDACGHARQPCSPPRVQRGFGVAPALANDGFIQVARGDRIQPPRPRLMQVERGPPGRPERLQQLVHDQVGGHVEIPGGGPERRQQLVDVGVDIAAVAEGGHPELGDQELLRQHAIEAPSSPTSAREPPDDGPSASLRASRGCVDSWGHGARGV